MCSNYTCLTTVTFKKCTIIFALIKLQFKCFWNVIANEVLFFTGLADESTGQPLKKKKLYTSKCSPRATLKKGTKGKFPSTEFISKSTIGMVKLFDTFVGTQMYTLLTVASNCLNIHYVRTFIGYLNSIYTDALATTHT